MWKHNISIVLPAFHSYFVNKTLHRCQYSAWKKKKRCCVHISIDVLKRVLFGSVNLNTPGIYAQHDAQADLFVEVYFTWYGPIC